MPQFQAAILMDHNDDGETPPSDVNQHMLGVMVKGGISEPASWREIRRFAAKGFVTGRAGSEKIKRLERLAKHGPIPRLPSPEEMKVIEVPESFEDVAPPHNERISLMKSQGFNPYEVTSHPTKEESLALFYVFETGAEVLEGLDLSVLEEATDESSTDEATDEATDDEADNDDQEATPE